MPQLADIAGCGLMACSNYEEMTAAIDRVYAVAEDQPLSLDEAFAALAVQARPPSMANLPKAGPEPEP
jgi:hypothetical protein